MPSLFWEFLCQSEFSTNKFIKRIFDLYQGISPILSSTGLCSTRLVSQLVNDDSSAPQGPLEWYGRYHDSI